MRKLGTYPILVFTVLFSVALLLGAATTMMFFGRLSLGDFRGVALVFTAVVLVYLCAIVTYRLFLYAFPLREGDIAEGSRDEIVAQVNVLFYLVLFNSLIRTHFLPVPLVRLIYLVLGARLGKNTYSAGAILDPPLTRIGNDCIIGHDAVLFSHAIEGRKFSLAAIRVGNNVTIGAKAVIMSGVTIEDGAIVSAGAVVTKDTHIGPGETWGGIPARLLKGSNHSS